MSFVIEDELKKLPASPGVYIMHDAGDDIIYVGKAVVLKNRVRQYFQGSRNKSQKIAKMVPQIARFEYIVTDSEMEALILECNLIKTYRPKYNTLLKDDKAYPYIRVSVEEEFPRIIYSHRMKKDKSRYFGPYSAAAAVKETIDLVRKLYSIRNCSKKIPSKAAEAEGPCLYYHIHQCDAPCIGKISAEDYGKLVDGALKFLGGDDRQVLQDLNAKMKKASEDLQFEQAALYRDQIEAVKRIRQSQKAAFGSGDDNDIVALACRENEAIAQVFFVREGRLIGREHYYLKTAPDEERSEIMAGFIKQYYAETPFVPAKLMLSEETKDAQLLSEWLSDKRGAKVTLTVPKKGTREKLVELAVHNAEILLEQDVNRLKNEESRTRGAVEEICSLLGLQSADRMEAFDISNISGFSAVGSMVVYEEGKPVRNDYRKFRIKAVDGPNDYASMEEVLTRRFERAKANDAGFEKLPDLLLMDGGKGQVNICLKILDRLGLDIPVAGMVKDDRHRTRGIYFNNLELPIDKDSEGFRLITRIQDEAHRFAITYHRALRGKNQVHSILDDIPNIGPKRRRELMRVFENQEAIRAASVEELAAIPSMDMRSARSVWDFFHNTNGQEDEDGLHQTE